jgi:hypothetical protein
MTNCCFMNYMVDNSGIVSQTFEIVVVTCAKKPLCRL